MIAKPIAAILAAAILVSASGTVGSFYLVGAQDQDDEVTTGQAEITLSDIEASPGSVVDVNGSNFGADSQVSIYFMSAKQANFANGSAFVLQGINANQSITATDQEADGNFFDEDEDALNTLEVLLELSNDQGSNNTTTADTPNTSEGNLLVALEGRGTPNNGTMSLECDDEILAEGSSINDTIVTFAVPPRTYDGCSISISDGNITDTGEIGNLTVVSDSKEDYQNSAVTSVTADEQGVFEASVRVPNIEEGDYAILAVGDDRTASVSGLLVTSAQPVTETEGTFANATAGIINETITQTPEEELAEEESTELLTAEIISNGTQGVAPATFEFEANVTGGTEPYTYSWDFGDDSEESDDEETVSHTFDEAGTYNVTLTATDSEDQNASVSLEINVEEPAEEGEAATIAIQNQTQNNQTDTREEGTVHLDETSAQPGSPLAISGEGFQPDTPIQIFINNVQITNVITNVEGSFNTVVIVPTTVAAGSAQVVVRTEQTSIAENVNIVELDGRSEVPSTLRLTAVSATDNGRALNNAPVTIFDASSGQLIESGKTPMDIELQEGTYSVFYSDFERFEFESAEPGRWVDTADGGVGLITIREGRNTTVTAIYSERPAPPPPPPRETENSLTLRAQDTQGNLIQNMFVTVYNVDATEKIEQGFTELRVDDLSPGTYPIFFANFDDLVFISASPGTWIQAPFGGVGLVTIPDDGEDHNLVVTALYNRTTVVEEQFNIQAPIDLEGHIFTITSNQTRPEGPFVMSGSFALRVSDEEPVSATLSAYIMSAREDSNENVDLESQRSRDHDTFQIVDLKPQIARPTGLNSYVVSGTADLLLNGDMYSNDERIVVIVRGGEELTPTNVEIEFRGDERYSAANRLETLYGVVSSGFE